MEAIILLPNAGTEISEQVKFWQEIKKENTVKQVY